jgi:hypothetical protein
VRVRAGRPDGLQRRRLPAAASAARPFATAGVALTASLGTTVQLHARVGAGVTLLRDAYNFGGADFHRAGPITATAGLGVGLRWP